MTLVRGSYLGLLFLIGCGGAEQPANSPTCPPGQIFDGRYCQMQAGPGTGGAATTPPNNAGGAASPSPSPVPAPSPGVVTATCTSPAAPIDVSAAQAVTGALLPLAAQKAMPGAKPLGSPLAAQLQQGQCIETVVSMSPGKCYSVVASGLPGIQNVDLALVSISPIPGVPQVVAASDDSVGPTAVLGANPNCFKWALPLAGTMKLILSAPSGQGIAAAQVFEK
jgi:hypothetical protein